MFSATVKIQSHDGYDDLSLNQLMIMQRDLIHHVWLSIRLNILIAGN